MKLKFQDGNIGIPMSVCVQVILRSAAGKQKKLAAFRSKNAAKYHLQTAITPFAKLTYFYQGACAISI